MTMLWTQTVSVGLERDLYEEEHDRIDELGTKKYDP